jgi:alpha-L-fucosidase
MKMSKRFACVLVMALSLAAGAQQLSKEALLDFVNMRYHAYFHYNMATFKNLHSEKRVGRAYGDDPVTMWRPTGLDCKQWAQTCIDARMAGGWLTTKHHGGFCLWDSQHTDYDVAASPVKTDVVRAFVDAFRKAGLKIGLYYSVLDYHHGIKNKDVSQEEIAFMQAQLTELLSNYGPIDYINFDGWATWPTVPNFDDVPYSVLYTVVKAIQPHCLIINHCYESNLAHADIPFADAAGRSYPFHADYMRPTAASDFIQRGWWWDDNNDYGVAKSVNYILKQLHSYNSHDSVYVLNLSPGPDGRIPDDVVARLKEVAAVWKQPADLTEPGENWGFQYDVSANLAFMRSASQSSTAPFIRDKRAFPRAEIAIDGVFEGNGLMEQCSMTKQEDSPWWQVDLERSCVIDSITLYARTDKASDNLESYRVTVLDKKGEAVWEIHKNETPTPAVTFSVGAVKGRVIKIQAEGKTALHLAEVVVTGQESREQDPNDIAVSTARFATVEVSTNHGKRKYHLDNSGDVEVSRALQQIFDEIAALPDVSATFDFAPGIYFLDAPVTVQIPSVKIQGHGHGGIDIHGANFESGSIFRFGKNCGPNCITFKRAQRSRAFPSGESPWNVRNLKVELENLAFAGYNNTGVDTAHGYSRFRGDEPNFRGLHWYPGKGRYQDVEAEGQRAIVLPRGNGKIEMFRVTGCYFTDLYVGLDVAGSDVSYIDKNWFGQLTHGIRYHGMGQVTFISNNCFADLGTAMTLAHPIMSSLHNNSFAYVSKCFEIGHLEHSSIVGNTLYNWKISTGAAAYGAFFHIRKSQNVTITGNSIAHYLDSRKRTTTVDAKSNGQSFIQFDNASQLLFSNNVVHTVLTQSVIRLHNATGCVITDNIITHGEGGNAVAQTGQSNNNYYRIPDPKASDPFDAYKY